ncbi:MULTISPECIES: hypothetical protein [unclassified Nocardiopsis]|uniref:hypothetical protein n=1 Tax=unclassified Nocardiopsis TaxID=2649073 RepID=UPI001F5BCCED|nr:hypothetical protein [Nocardiopsis sp. TSRI0078]
MEERGTPRPRTGSEVPPRLDAALLRLSGVLLVGACATLLDSTVVTVAVDRLSWTFDAPVPRSSGWPPPTCWP